MRAFSTSSIVVGSVGILIYLPENRLRPRRPRLIALLRKVFPNQDADEAPRVGMEYLQQGGV